MNKRFVSIKDLIYWIIILVLIILLIISKKDLELNIINKDNWIDIILNGISILCSTILSILIIWQGFNLNNRSKKFEIETFNKQIDLDLRDRRLEIFKSFESIIYKLDNKDNQELLDLLEKLVSMYSDYCLKLQTFWGDMYKATEESIIMLRNDGFLAATKFIPKELIDTDYNEYKKCVSIFEKYYKEVKKSELDIVNFVSSKEFNEAFEKDINIEKIKEV